MKMCKLVWINKFQYISTLGNSLTNTRLQADIASLSLCSSWSDLIQKLCWLLGDSKPMQTSCLEVCLLTWAQHHTYSKSCSSSEPASFWLRCRSRWASVCCSLLCRYTQYYFPLQGNGNHLHFIWSETTYLLNNNTL